MEPKKQIREQIKYAGNLFQADKIIRQYTGFKTSREKTAFLKGMFDEALEIKNLENPESYIDPENELYRRCLNSVMVKDTGKDTISINVKQSIWVRFKKTNRHGTHIFDVYEEDSNSQVGQIRLLSDDSVKFINKNDEWKWGVQVISKFSALRLRNMVSQNCS